MRLLKFLFSILTAATLAGCAGYHLGAVNGAITGGQSIEVLPFNNQTLQPRLGATLTQSLREQLQTDGTFHLATGGAGGDIVVTGVIRNYQRKALGYLSTDASTPEDYRVDVVVDVVVRERDSGKLLMEKDVKGHTLVHIGTDLASAERQALPLLADDLARNITELLTEGMW